MTNVKTWIKRVHIKYFLFLWVFSYIYIYEPGSLVSCFCYLNIYVFLSTFLCSPCLSFVLKNNISCLNFWDEACWFLSLRVFGLLSSSSLLFSQCLANMSSGLLQVFVKLGNLHRTLNYILYWIHGSPLFWFH